MKKEKMTVLFFPSAFIISPHLVNLCNYFFKRAARRLLPGGKLDYLQDTSVLFFFVFLNGYVLTGGRKKQQLDGRRDLAAMPPFRLNEKRPNVCFTTAERCLKLRDDAFTMLNLLDFVKTVAGSTLGRKRVETWMNEGFREEYKWGPQIVINGRRAGG